ncbi:hypothetical protein [Methanoregula sp.]|jgi:hypothetical protein|uniref:hypothetical protein n=1 Tax=Methanoregula sp. TaxID=2052170 RepID=UPI003C171256
MNLIIIKYGLLIGAILASTAVVTGPLNPQKLFTDPENAQLTADSVYQFGSDVFYKELDKPGNEYMKSSVSGYSQSLIATNDMDNTFQEQWNRGVTAFESGYSDSTTAFYELLDAHDLPTAQQKVAVCRQFSLADTEFEQSLEYFAAAKASATPGSAQGFTIGMVIPRIEAIREECQNAEISCKMAVLADTSQDPAGFSANVKDTQGHIKEIQRIYPELKGLSSDFS